MEFNVPHTELQVHLPSLQKLKSPPETPYALLTCHHTIPNLQSVKQGGWGLHVGSGKKVVHKLDGLVCGAVSCCGEDGVISTGANKSSEYVGVQAPHQNECCMLNLDFTMLFLNQNFEKLVTKKGIPTLPKLPQVHIPSSSVPRDPQALFSQIESDAASGTEARMQLYHREESDDVILPVKIDHSLATGTGDDESRQQLKNEVAKYKKYQRIHYTETVASGKIVESYSGSAIVYYDPVTGKMQLVGIHIGAAMDKEESGAHTADPKRYIGLSIHGVIELLSGRYYIITSCKYYIHSLHCMYRAPCSFLCCNGAPPSPPNVDL